jgi:hypothetical protein
MSNSFYDGNEEEKYEADDRIGRIVGGGGGGSGSQNYSTDASYDSSDPLGGSDALDRARSRLRGRGGQEQYADSDVTSKAQVRGLPQKSARGTQALIVIGGIVALGVVVVLILFIAAPLLTGGGGAGVQLPWVPTSTPTPTPTPLPTPTPTPTKVAPALALPPLTCIFQSGTGCFDYCANAANTAECNSAKDFVRAQGADPDVWLKCIAAVSGPNTGDPQKCLEDAWRASNP